VVTKNGVCCPTIGAFNDICIMFFAVLSTEPRPFRDVGHGCQADIGKDGQPPLAVVVQPLEHPGTRGPRREGF
jgi:hypothetical protein